MKRLDVVLVRPSKYDDDGYVIRHFRGTLPCNTLSCLYGLTEAVVKSGRFDGRVEVRIHAYDETVQRVVPERIARRLRRRSDCVLVGIVGVQTNQFPRAADLARQFVAAGCKVMMGGFHVSGAIAMSREMPRECKELMESGVTVVKGEVEEVWGDLLEDAVEGRLRLFYDIKKRPELDKAPVPKIPPGYMKRFVYKGFGTIDTSRGCPFGCTFCTVINVQGRKMRVRSPEAVLEAIRENYRRLGIKYYIITDDNLARNRHWEEVFDGLIRMRREEGIPIEFFMQVDVKSYKVPGFVRKASEAGCTQVFVGIESLNPKNLEAAGKTQNSVDEYATMVEAWHEVGVHVHGAYIIGFPYDTYDSIMEDVDRLAREIKIDQASFFMLTPLPGSQDHAEAVAAGVPMDEDFNRYDSFHAVTDHPRMSREEWEKAYRDAWKRFYSFENMKQILLRSDVHTYWGMLKGFLWYRAGMVEGIHPMLTGLFRLKSRKDRRPGYPVDPLFVHLRKRWREVWQLLRAWAGLFREMQELWLQTRIPSERIKALRALRGCVDSQVADLASRLRNAHRGLQGSVGQYRAALEQQIEALRSRLPSVALPEAGRKLDEARASCSRWMARKLRLLCDARLSTRQHLDRFWSQLRLYFHRRMYWRINPFQVVWYFARDVRLSLSFTICMLAERIL